MRFVHVAVEAQVKVDQVAHLLHHMVVEAQRLEPFARHLGTHRIVVVEAHLASRLESAGLRLANVMHQAAKRSTIFGAGTGPSGPVSNATARSTTIIVWSNTSLWR